MGPSVACAPNTTRWCPVTHQMSLLFMSHALSAKHRRCVRRVLAAGEKCSSHGDELLLAAAAHRGRCISTAASRCRRQYRRRQRFYVDLAVLYGSWLLLRGHLAALPAWADGPLTRQPGAHRRHPSRCHAWDSWRPTETEGSVHSNVFYESVTQCVTWACRQSVLGVRVGCERTCKRAGVIFFENVVSSPPRQVGRAALERGGRLSAHKRVPHETERKATNT